jgi:redox-sensitive bicupin YhaK (pirin superfamily)
MTTLRPIEGVFSGAPFHWVGDGFHVQNYFPGGVNLGQRFSPFIMMDYAAPKVFPPSPTPRGVDAHPHRGFETVSIAYDGYVEHHDNFGNHGIIGPGDVQWMTAGSGLLHKEYHERAFSKRGGKFHMIQLWVNLPKAHKMHPPQYQELPKESMGYAALPNDGGQVRVISGTFRGTLENGESYEAKGPAKTFTPVHLFDFQMKQKGHVRFACAETDNTAVMVLQGRATINGTEAGAGSFILFGNESGDIAITALTEEALVICLSGEPINEPMVARGPFVMTSTEELIQAYQDFHEGKMGPMHF